MKQFKFEIILNEEDLAGDEFWEDAIKQDGTGITTLKELLGSMIDESNIIISSEKSGDDVVKLISYKDE